MALGGFWKELTTGMGGTGQPPPPQGTRSIATFPIPARQRLSEAPAAMEKTWAVYAQDE